MFVHGKGSHTLSAEDESGGKINLPSERSQEAPTRGYAR